MNHGDTRDNLFGAPGPEDVHIDEQVKCIERELHMRKRVYPHWVSEGRIKQDKADREILVMRAVLQTLRHVRKARR